MAIKKELEIKYVAMPISIEKKKEYHAQGFRVVDAKFAPEGYKVETEVDDEKARKAAERKAKREAARAAKEDEQDETEQDEE